MWIGLGTAHFLDAAVQGDQSQLLLGRERHSQQGNDFIECSGRRPFHAGAVVAEDVEDERIVELPLLFDGA